MFDRCDRRRLPAATLLAAAVLLLAGCASLSPDAGFGGVQAAVAKELVWARSPAEQDAVDRRVAALLARPLAADDAVQLALLNNRGLQARFHDLGIAEAEVVQAGRLPNPGFGFARLRRGGEREIERSLQFDLARLLALPLLAGVEQRRQAQLRTDVVLDVLALAAETRKAWVSAVAADEGVRYMQQVRQAADASAELARRMEAAGNFSRLARAREQAFQADAVLDQMRAEQQQRSARERLTRLLGLAGTQAAFRLPPRLPDLPERPVLPDRPDLPDVPDQADRPDVHDRPDRPELSNLPDVPDRSDRLGTPDRTDTPDRTAGPAPTAPTAPPTPAAPADGAAIERLALAQRLDVQAARVGVEQTARNLGLTRTTRFVNVLELGAVRNTSNVQPRETGWEVGFELPLFDWGEARVARAEGIYMQALQRAAQTAVDAQSEVREAHANVRSAHAIARHRRDALLPLARRISDEQLLRYNGMLIGVFDLLADARAQIAGVHAAMAALRDYWLAQADLERALTGPAAR